MGRQSIVPIVMIMVNIALGSTGQILLKYGVSGLNTEAGHGLAAGLLAAAKAMFTPYVFLGMSLYAASAIIWIYVLSQVRLSFAYPMMSFSYVVVVLLSALILGEKVPIITIGGLLFISIGVSLIGIGYGTVK